MSKNKKKTYTVFVPVRETLTFLVKANSKQEALSKYHAYYEGLYDTTSCCDVEENGSLGGHVYDCITAIQIKDQ